MVVFNRKILLERYLDGECTPAERERAERLLERSPSLRDDLDLLRQVDRIVDGAGCFPVHPSYQAQFDRKLAAVEESAEEP